MYLWHLQRNNDATHIRLSAYHGLQTLGEREEVLAFAENMAQKQGTIHEILHFHQQLAALQLE